MPDPIASLMNEMTPGAVPIPTLGDPYADLAAKAKAKYPRLANYPIKVTSAGPPIDNGSETYPPTEDQNPHPGNWTIQLNPKKMTGDPVDNVGLEMIHTLQGADPQYQKFTDQFVRSMTPGQLADSQRAYKRDMKDAGDNFMNTGKPESFDSWMRRVQGQEYIRGGIFTKVIPNWIGPKGEGRYTPEQTKLLDQIKQYLQTPAGK